MKLFNVQFIDYEETKKTAFCVQKFVASKCVGIN